MTPQQIIDRLSLAGTLFGHDLELSDEMRREGDKLTVIPVLGGSRLPMYFTIKPKKGRVRLRKVSFLHFIPKEVGVAHVKRYIEARLHFHRWTLSSNGIGTRFAQDWTMKVGNDLIGNLTVAFTAFSDADSIESFMDDWAHFYAELADFGVAFMHDLHRHTHTAIIDDASEGHRQFNLGKDRIKA